MSAELDLVLEKLREEREKAWNLYLNAPTGAAEMLRQGKFEGIDRAVRVVAKIQKKESS